jgi:hypothetical protein
MRQIQTLIAVLVSLGISASAAPVTATDITQLGTSAHHIGLANISGFNQSASGVFENPASLYSVDRWSGSFFSTTVMDEVEYLSIAGAYRFKHGVLALARMGASVSDIPNTAGQYNASNELIGIDTVSVFEYGNYVYKLGYQTMLENQWSLGLAFNYYRVNAGTHLKGSGVNMDIGAIRQFDRLDLSMVVQNAIPNQNIKYSNDGNAEKLPSRYLIAGKYKPTEYYSVLSEVKKYEFHSDMFFSAALEYEVFHRLLKSIDWFFRVGQRNFPVSPIRVRSATTFGLGFAFHFLSLDYAYQISEHPDYDFQHYVSFSVNMPLRVVSKSRQEVAIKNEQFVPSAQKKPYKLVMGSHHRYSVAQNQVRQLSQIDIPAKIVAVYPQNDDLIYAIQMGAYKTSAQCQRESGEYLQKGIVTTCIDRQRDQTRLNHVLIVGFYADRSLANRAAYQIKQQGVQTYIWQRDPVNQLYLVYHEMYGTKSACLDAEKAKQGVVLNAYCVYHEE